MLQLICIKTKDKVYLSDNINNLSYFNSKLTSYMFNGLYPEKTYKSDWVEVKEIPSIIQQLHHGKQINHRYELKEGFWISKCTPNIVEYKYDGDTQESFPEEMIIYKPLYDLKYDLTEDEIVEVPFEITVITEEENFKIVKEDYKLTYNLLDQLNTHPVLLTTKPCKLSSQESYNIIREHIKRNIDREFAIITSDYDFCLKVEKVIKIEGRYEEFYYPFRKKNKTEKKYITDRKMIIYETAPDRIRDGVYKGYTRTKEFEGKNYEDLCNNIKSYLDNLIELINAPLKECTHCKGFGVIH